MFLNRAFELSDGTAITSGGDRLALPLALGLSHVGFFPDFSFFFDRFH